MPPTCSICGHEARNDIDRDLIGPDSLRAIAGRYGVSSSSLDRHRHNCLAPKVAAAIARREEVSADRLVSYTNGLLDHALAGMLRARKQDPPDEYGARAYMAESRKTIELLAKLGHVIGDRGPVVQIDVRRQQLIANLDALTLDELRALARGASDVDVIEGVVVGERDPA